MKLTPTTVRADQTAYSADTRTFYAEASSIGAGPSRLYDDAADIGYGIKGYRRTEIFSLAGEKRDAEGDLLEEIYKSDAGYTLIVFND